MNTILINSATVDSNLQKLIHKQGSHGSLDLKVSNKQWYFCELSKKKIIETLCEQSWAKLHWISFVDHQQLQKNIASSLMDTLVSYSWDFTNSTNIDKAIKIKCYERSIAFQIAMYHRWLASENTEEIARWRNELSVYTWFDPDGSIINLYLSDENIKKQSLEYFSWLRKADNPGAVDLILSDSWAKDHILVWTRKEYPRWSAWVWWYIDKQDAVIGSSLGLSKEQASIISAIREWFEETSWLKVSDEIIAQKINYKKEEIWGNTLITWTIRAYKLWVAIDQEPILYIEDPQSPDFNPWDTRGPAATIARKWVVLTGSPSPEGSSDLEKTEWITNEQLTKVQWAMKHHGKFV